MSEPASSAPHLSGEDAFGEVCVQAITLAAADLGLDPRAFADELAQGEIGLLISYLRSSVDQVADLELRANIESLLYRLTAWTSTR
jgi:hypothetical protein